jgi:hypothetical protein
MFEAARDNQGAEEDAPVGTSMDSVPGFEHGTGAGQGGVQTDLFFFELLAVFAGFRS